MRCRVCREIWDLDQGAMVLQIYNHAEPEPIIPLNCVRLTVCLDTSGQLGGWSDGTRRTPGKRNKVENGTSCATHTPSTSLERSPPQVPPFPCPPEVSLVCKVPGPFLRKVHTHGGGGRGGVSAATLNHFSTSSPCRDLHGTAHVICRSGLRPRCTPSPPLTGRHFRLLAVFLPSGTFTLSPGGTTQAEQVPSSEVSLLPTPALTCC